MTKKTLRLTFPQWQGGINPPYYEGSHILDWLAPKSDSMECAKVPVKTNFDDEVPVTDGIAWKEELLEQQKAAYAICEEKDPDRIIVLADGRIQTQGTRDEVLPQLLGEVPGVCSALSEKVR